MKCITKKVYISEYLPGREFNTVEELRNNLRKVISVIETDVWNNRNLATDELSMDQYQHLADLYKELNNNPNVESAPKQEPGFDPYDGEWHDHNPGDPCPVSDDTNVCVELRNDLTKNIGCAAGYFDWGVKTDANIIVRYRVVTEETK